MIGGLFASIAIMILEMVLFIIRAITIEEKIENTSLSKPMKGSHLYNKQKREQALAKFRSGALITPADQ